MKKTSLLCILIIGFMLAGCKSSNDEIYLLRHQAKFQAILQQCEVSPNNARANECDFVQRLYTLEMQLVRKLVNDPVEYGQNILLLQMEQGDVLKRAAQVKQILQQDNLSTAKREKFTQILQEYQQKITEISRQLKIRLTLLAMSEKM